MNKELSHAMHREIHGYLHLSSSKLPTQLPQSQQWEPRIRWLRTVQSKKHILLYHNHNTRKHKKRSTYKRSLIYIYIYLQIGYRRLHMPKIFLHHPSCKLVEFDWPRKNVVGNCYLSLTIVDPNFYSINNGFWGWQFPMLHSLSRIIYV